MTSSFSSAAPLRRHPTSSAEALVGATVAGKYRIVRPLGHGGMGTVYKAENVLIGKVVAIKLLHGSLQDDDIAMQRFQREARSMVAIAHRNIVEVIDMGRDASGSPYLVMEYVRGSSLKIVIAKSGPLSVERAARIAGHILDALAATHRRGIIHRDLKPENILISGRSGDRDVVKVVDFGISTFADSVAEHEREADLTPTGLTMATPYYASPEQIRGANGRDARVDLYAVGVLLYEMMSGHRPFEGDNLPELCTRILAGEIAPLYVFRKDVPPTFEAIIRKALANRAQDRYQSAAELAQALVPFGAEPLANEEPDPTDTFTSADRALGTLVSNATVEPVPTIIDVARAVEPLPAGGTERSPGSVVVHEKLARGLFGHFALHYGNAEVRQLLEALEPAVRNALSAKACQSQALGHALGALDRRFGRGNRAQLAAAGRHFVNESLRDGELAASAMPELFFSLAAGLWQRYLGLGEARVTRIGRGYGRLEVSYGATQARAPLALSVAMVGVLEQGLKTSGAREAAVQMAESTALDGRIEAFEATWLR
jgi:serine/threonine protein kinase